MVGILPTHSKAPLRGLSFKPEESADVWKSIANSATDLRPCFGLHNCRVISVSDSEYPKVCLNSEMKSLSEWPKRVCELYFAPAHLNAFPSHNKGVVQKGLGRFTKDRS
ncbi:hypothetical protein ILYODFUR_023973 [Ilyodon furcidens]|uniref:Uncharacterized protein n=2 Tax=Goodeidae TaxID=28758 RepID=A0ABV0V5M2_9TELE